MNVAAERAIGTLAMPAVFATVERADKDRGAKIVLKKIGGALLVLAVMASPVLSEDDFPIAGTYTKDATCRGEASKREDLRVKITGNQIQSTMGTCTILQRKRDGNTIAAQVECKVPGDQLILGDVTFTIRDDHTLDFDDQYHTSAAVLYKCAE
jgi:hypothetical protein